MSGDVLVGGGGEEDLVLDLVGDAGVAADDLGERLSFHEAQDLPVEMGLVPEAVAVAQCAELAGQDAVHRLTDHGAAFVWLAKGTGPQVDIIDRLVGILQFPPDLAVAIDVGEAAGGPQAEALASAIEALLNDDEGRRDLGEVARARVADELSPERTAEAYERIYEELHA